METLEQITIQVQIVRQDGKMALVFDSSVLDQLNLAPGTPLTASISGHSVIIAPAQDPARRAAFEAALEETNQMYAHTLQRLAE